MLARQRSRCARWSRSGSPTFSGSLENLLDPDRLQLDVVVAGGGAAGEGREGGRPPSAEKSVVVGRVDERADLGCHELGRASDTGRDHGAPDAIASSVASPKGSTSSAGRGRRRPRPTPGPHRGPRARRPEFRADPRAHRAAARLRRTQARPRRVARTRARRRTFFRSERAPRQRNAVPPARAPAELGPCSSRVPRREALEIHPQSTTSVLPARRAPPVRAASGASPTPRRRQRRGGRRSAWRRESPGEPRSPRPGREP